MCYTGRSSAAETYACFPGDYTAMVIFPSNHGSARREVEGGEARKEWGWQQKDNWGSRAGMSKGRVKQKGERGAEGPENAVQTWSKTKEWDMKWSLLGTQQDGKKMMRER